MGRNGAGSEAAVCSRCSLTIVDLVEVEFGKATEGSPGDGRSSLWEFWSRPLAQVT